MSTLTAHTNSKKISTYFDGVIIGSGSVVVLIGAFVLFGWYVKNITLIQILPSFVPMQYNTALGFLLCGLSVFLIYFGKPKVAIVLGGVAGIIGFLTILEYISGRNIQIDELLMNHDITVETSHPGRMAPNTALCFLLSSIAIGLNIGSPKARQLSGVIGSLIFGLGFVAFIGYVTGNKATYGWGNLTCMAVHTAFGFIILGCGLSIFSWRHEHKQNKQGQSTLKPAILGYALTLAITIFLIDISLPSNVVEDGLYVGLVFLGWFIPRKRATLILAVLATILSIMGFLLSAIEVNLWVLLFNRVVALIAIWTVAILLDNIKIKDLALEKAKEDLNSKIIEQIARNKELEQFAYIASHDMQEPMRTISSFADLLAKRYSGQFDETGNKSLQFIKGASDRMGELNKGLLDYSRIGRKKEIVNCDCNAIIEEIKSELAPQINNSKTTIYLEKLPIIKGYKHELKYLFHQLISNSIKFKNTERAPEISITSTTSNQIVSILFSDNGIGIAKENYEKIFMIFQRLHPRTAYEGTGVGLAQCRKIVELHGGDISVTSKLGKGCTFKITLPI